MRDIEFGRDFGRGLCVFLNSMLNSLMISDLALA